MDSSKPQPHDDTNNPQSSDDVTNSSEDKKSIEQRNEEYLAGWKRAMADYANLKKETERMRVELAQYATVGVVTKLLPVYENLCKASMQMPGETVDMSVWRQWAQGVTLTTSQFEQILKQIGVEKIDQIGSFDPSLHEAVMSEVNESAASGDVIKILEPGYKLHDRVLRPAKVVVVK